MLYRATLSVRQAVDRGKKEKEEEKCSSPPYLTGMEGRD